MNMDDEEYGVLEKRLLNLLFMYVLVSGNAKVDKNDNLFLWTGTEFVNACDVIKNEKNYDDFIDAMIKDQKLYERRKK